MSERTAPLTPGYWTLTATSRPSWQARAVDLADRGRGDRLRSKSRSSSSARRAPRRSPPHAPEAHLRRRIAQLGELALELLAVFLGDEADVQEREDLASFIAAPFIVPSAATTARRSRLVARERLRGVTAPPLRLAARVPGCRAAWPAASPATRAVRAIREVGMRSLRHRARPRFRVPASARAVGAAAGAGASVVLLRARPGVGVGSGVVVSVGGGGSAWPTASPSAWGSPSGSFPRRSVSRSASASVRPPTSASLPTATCLPPSRRSRSRRRR